MALNYKTIHPLLWSLPLGMVVSAPLFNYLGHAVELTMAGLGIVLMLSQTAWKQRIVAPWHELKDNKPFTYGVALAILAVVSWGYSSWYGIHPATWGSWLGLLPILALLSVFGIYAAQLPVTCHRAWVSALAFITTAMAVLVVIERCVPMVSVMLGHGVRDDRLNFTAQLLVFGLPYVLQKWRYHPTYWAMPAMVFMAVAISNGRIGWVVAPVIMLAYMLATWKVIGLRRWVQMSAVATFSAAIGGVLLVWAQGAAFMAKRVNDLAAGGGSGRIDIWRYALQNWWENHVWFGIGVQGFRRLDFTDVALKSTAHPHNSVVQLLLETGLVGTSLTLLTVSYMVWRSWRHMEESWAERLPVLLSFMGAVGCSLASTSLFHAWWLVLMFTPLAWALGWPRAVQQKK